MKTYPKGYRFRVPTSAELLNAGTGWSLMSNGFLKPPDSLRVPFLSQDALDNVFLGRILTVFKPSVYYSEAWRAVETGIHTWPVEEFERVTGVLDQIAHFGPGYSPDVDLASRASHTCQEGMTPLDGYVICKVCGVNMRKF